MKDEDECWEKFTEYQRVGDLSPDPTQWRKPFFTPEGKIALAFLMMYTKLSAPMLMEQLNANIHYQIFCGIRIHPAKPLTDYKIIDKIMGELSSRLKIQTVQTHWPRHGNPTWRTGTRFSPTPLELYLLHVDKWVF